MNCKECQGKLVYDKYETFCGTCGLIAEDLPIDLGNESNDPDKPGRTGAPTTWLNPEIGSTFKPWERNKK